MAGPWDYVTVITESRYLKSMLVKPEDFKEAIMSETLGDAVSALRSSLYEGLAEARNPYQVYRSLWSTYFSLVKALAKLSPPESRPLVWAFAREEELRDLLVIAQSAELGSPVESHLPSATAPWTLTSRAMRDPESLTSPQRLGEILAGSWAEKYFAAALKIYQDTRGSVTYSWATMALLPKLYIDALRKLPLPSRRRVERVICPLQEFRLFASLLKARIENVDARTLGAIMPPARICGVDLGELHPIYEREPDPRSMALSLREKLGRVEFSGESIGDILESAQLNARRRARESSYTAFSGYPFQPSLTSAILQLIKLEIEDVSAVLLAKEYRLKPEEISVKISLNIA